MTDCACRWDGPTQTCWCRPHMIEQTRLLARMGFAGLKVADELKIAWGHHYPAKTPALWEMDKAAKAMTDWLNGGIPEWLSEVVEKNQEAR